MMTRELKGNGHGITALFAAAAIALTLHFSAGDYTQEAADSINDFADKAAEAFMLNH